MQQDSEFMYKNQNLGFEETEAKKGPLTEFLVLDKKDTKSTQYWIRLDEQVFNYVTEHARKDLWWFEIYSLGCAWKLFLKRK